MQSTATKLLNYLADLLEFPQALRRGISHRAIDGVLWHLGKMRIGHVACRCVAGPRPVESIDDVFRHFPTISTRHGLIFTTGQAQPGDSASTPGYRIIPIGSVLSRTAPARRRHRPDPSTVAGRPRAARWSSRLPVRFDHYTNTLHITTNRQALDDQGPQAGCSGEVPVRAVRERTAMGFCRRHPGRRIRITEGRTQQAGPEHLQRQHDWQDYIEHDEAEYGIKLE